MTIGIVLEDKLNELQRWVDQNRKSLERLRKLASELKKSSAESNRETREAIDGAKKEKARS